MPEAVLLRTTAPTPQDGQPSTYEAPVATSARQPVALAPAGGVTPEASRANTSAPCASRAVTAPAWPSSAAACQSGPSRQRPRRVRQCGHDVGMAVLAGCCRSCSSPPRPCRVRRVRFGVIEQQRGGVTAGGTRVNAHGAAHRGGGVSQTARRSTAQAVHPARESRRIQIGPTPKTEYFCDGIPKPWNNFAYIFLTGTVLVRTALRHTQHCLM